MSKRPVTSKRLVKTIFLSAVVATSLFASTQCFSMFVEDPVEWGKTMLVHGKLVEELGEMKDQFTMLRNQFNQLKQQYSAITGNYGFGSFHNSLTDLEHEREFTASKWHDMLNGLAGGNPARYQQLLAQYKQAHPTLDTTAYAKGADKNLAANYQNEVKTNQASATTATYEFNDINKHLKILYELGQKIENAKNNKNLKSSMDLNSRINLEVGYINAEEVRMTTILNQQLAQIQSSRIAHESEASQFNQAGE